MTDFTLRIYQDYARALKGSFALILRFDEYFAAEPRPGQFCLVRHDVDRNPYRALRMARLENLLGLKTTYYFRANRTIFKTAIARAIHEWGHEIGYHYESLSETKGCRDLAIKDFERNLSAMRKIVPVNTVARHGRPLGKYDNLDLWRDPDDYSIMKRKYGLLGEVYLEIDYSDVAYITDTGRNWSSFKSNKRDIVQSHIKTEFRNGKELLRYFRNSPHPRLVFVVHPERWTELMPAYCARYLFDYAANRAKDLLR